MSKFIAWRQGEQVLHLALAGDGVSAVEDIDQATAFPDYEAAYAVFLQYRDALHMLDGAILDADEIAMQFDPERPYPRMAFNLSPEVIQAQAMAVQLELAEMRDTLQLERAQAASKAEDAAKVAEGLLAAAAVIAEMRKGNAKAVAAAEAKVGAAAA